MFGRPGSATGGGSVDRGGYIAFTAPSSSTPTAPARAKHATATNGRGGRLVSATGSMESIRSADITGGNVRSDPGARMYATDNSGVCFDEKVLKQIR